MNNAGNANNKELNDDKVQRRRVIRKPGLWKKMEKRRREGGKEGERDEEERQTSEKEEERGCSREPAGMEYVRCQ